MRPIFTCLVAVAYLTASNDALMKGESIVMDQCALDFSLDNAGEGEVDRSRAYLLPRKAFTCEGLVNEWTFYATRAGSFLACVLRPQMNDKLVGCNTLTAKQHGGQIYKVPENERIMVQYSDVIGIKWIKQNDAQVISIRSTPAAGDTPTEVLSLTDFVQPELDSRLNYFYQEDYTPVYWTVPIRANVIGVSNALRLAADPVNRDSQASDQLRENTWGILCERWKESGASPEEMLAVLEKYVDWGSQQRHILTEYLSEILQFCAHRKNTHFAKSAINSLYLDG